MLRIQTSMNRYFSAVGFKSEAIRACSSINQAGQGRCRVIKKYTHPRRTIKYWTVDDQNAQEVQDLGVLGKHSAGVASK